MASSAAGHVLAKLFWFTIFGEFTVNTVIDLSVVCTVGEFPVGRWFFEVTFGRTVDFFGVGMGDHIKIEMTMPAQHFSMYRIFVGAIVHVKKAQTSILI